MMTPSVPIDRRTSLLWGARAVAALCALRSDVLADTSTRQEPAGPSPAPVSRVTTVGGVRLHYLEWGAGAGDRRPALVLLHPGMLNARIWERFGNAMAPFFRVIAPDARGHGESEWKAPYETDTFLGYLHGLLSGLGLRDLTLCGNSMGGTLAIAYAAAHPDLVRRLISVDTGAAPPPPPGSTAAPPPLPPPLPRGPFDDPRDAADRIAPVLGRGFIDAMLTTNLARAADGRWHWRHDDVGMSAALPRAMADPGRWTRWQSVTCPTLLVRGERSVALSAESARRMVEARPNATLQVVRDAGHFVELDQPEAFERAVRAWLGR